MLIKTFRYRLYPTESQARMFFVMLNASRHFYNMALAERKYAYEQDKLSLSRRDGEVLAKQYKKTFLFAKKVHSHVFQVANEDLHRAFEAFFKRAKAGADKVGYPRFRSIRRNTSFGFKQVDNGFSLDQRKIKISGVGRVAVRWHRPFEGQIKTCRVAYKAGHWYLSLACEIDTPPALPATGQEVGVDLGVNALLTLSNGTKVENPKWYRNSLRKLRIKQRQVARAKKGSRNRRKRVKELQKLHRHTVNQRHDYLNKVVFNLVKNYDLIALEDLRITNMVRNPHLSQSILDAGWGYLLRTLSYKAAEAGRTVLLVHPRNTSKTCSQCGKLHDMPLSQRLLECACGLVLDRDENAARNILKLAYSPTGHLSDSFKTDWSSP